MANTYYDSELTAEEIEEVLEAINGILNPANNGKVLAISNGKIEARSVQWDADLGPKSITENGTYNPASDNLDGYSQVTVNVSGSGGTTDANHVTYDSSVTYDSGTVGAALNEQRNTLNQLTRPNLLDNWYFGNPVNQRGNLIYSNAGYTIDRWSINAGALTIQADDIEIGADISFYQVMGNAPVGKLVTMTILATSGELITGSGVIPSSGNVTFAYDGNRYSLYYLNGIIAVEVYNTAFTLVAVKLELGSGQTLAHNEGTESNPVWVLNEVPDYSEQLYRCCASTADPSDTYANKPYNTKADESSLALRRSGATNTGAQIESGTYFYLDGTLKHAIATIAQNAPFTAQNCETVTAGGLNALKIRYIDVSLGGIAITNSDGSWFYAVKDISSSMSQNENILSAGWAQYFPGNIVLSFSGTKKIVLTSTQSISSVSSSYYARVYLIAI